MRYIPPRSRRNPSRCLEGRLIQDPYIGTNCWRPAGWSNVTDLSQGFRSAADALSSPHAWLNFEGLDYFAVIFLNARRSAATKTHSILPPVSRGKCVPAGTFWCATRRRALRRVGQTALGYVPEIMNDRERMTKRHWLRKPQCQFNGIGHTPDQCGYLQTCCA